MDIQLIIFIFLLVMLIIFCVAKQKLTIPAIILAIILAILIYSVFSLAGVALLGTFFLLGVGATAWNRKMRIRFPGNQGDKRDALQVLANGGVAGMLATMAMLFPDKEMPFLLITASALSSATADTLSSELGNVYGKRFYNIIGFKKDVQGENGVISFEGTACGILGSIIIALVYCIAAGFEAGSFIIIVIAGTTGNIVDSLLGATFERNHVIGNNAVNFINTLIAAATGGILFLVIGLTGK